MTIEEILKKHGLDKKYLRIEMPDTSKWDVPVSVIAIDRAQYYHDIGEYPTVEESLLLDTCPLFADDEYEIEDWAANNMDWDDVKSVAVQFRDDGVELDWQDGWANGDKEIIEKD